MENDSTTLQASIVTELKSMLDEHNPFAKIYRMARDKMQKEKTKEVKLRIIGKRYCDGRRYNLPSVPEVAGLTTGDFDSTDVERDIIVETHLGFLKRISILSSAYLPLQYPILYPHGKDGYREDVLFRDENNLNLTKRKNVSMREFFAFIIQQRVKENSILLHSKRLFQQFLVDAYSMIESSRLNYIRTHQKELKADMYKGLSEAILRGETNPSTAEKRIVLPSSFTGGARYMFQNYQDAMGICKWAGYPDLFITFTCNKKWPEICRPLQKMGLNSEDRPDLTCRVFKIKLDQLIKDMKRGNIFGKNKKSPCMQNGRCTRYFPKKFVERTFIGEDGYPIYRRRDSRKLIQKDRFNIDNRFIVPYNRDLLFRYNAHINVEWCNQSRSIKYLFKYVNKGHDRITTTFYETATNEVATDEIKLYYDCRYLSSCEATWRIYAFDIHFGEPSVERLSIHLPDKHVVVFEDHHTIDEVVSKSNSCKTKFLAWMEANKIYPDATNLTYAEFPTKFVWKKSECKWFPRKLGFSIGRVHFVPPSSGELFYMRILLNVIRGLESYTHIRTINNVTYLTYKDACYALGLLNDDKEYVDAIKEASDWGSAHFLRRLFITLLLSNQLTNPELIWDKTWQYLSDDVLYRQRTFLQHSDLELTELQLKSLTLAEVDRLLQMVDFPTMPQPDMSAVEISNNRLILDELNYDKQALNIEHCNLLSKMTSEQRKIYDTIMSAISKNAGGVFFLYGYRGTGKTFIWKTISAAIRSKGEIVLTVASSGIAALLIPGGRTAQSRFAIPININEDSTCNISQGSPLANLIIRTKLIIWDEAPMTHKHCFEAVDKTFRDILQFSNHESSSQPFGGKVVVFGGDFRQILPVVPKGRRQDIVNASINSSYLWNHVQVLRLTKNMRLKTGSLDSNVGELKIFSNWILGIGDGNIGEQADEEIKIEIPDDLLIKNSKDPLTSIVECTYPSFLNNMRDPSFFQDCAILAPTNEVVDMINQYMLSLMPEEAKTYLSFDSPCPTEEGFDRPNNIHTPEFLNSISSSGLPNHQLKLKIGVPIMLLTNIDQSFGMCNGTRLIITQLGAYVLEAKVISGSNDGQKVFIPRLSLTPSDNRIPFKFQRRQFPIIVSFAMTINKSQGQSLKNVGIYLPRSVFSHGQLYIAVSRVTNCNGLKILIHESKEQNTSVTSNVVYKDVFQNLN